VVKIRLLKDIGELKSGEIIETSNDAALAYINKRKAEYFEEENKKLTREEITKGMDEFVEQETKKHKEKVKKQKDRQLQKETLPEEKTLALDTKIITQEAILNSNEPKWLIVKKTRKTDATIKDIVDGEAFISEEITFEIKEPNQWQCNRCKVTTVADENQPIFCEACDRDATFKKITEKINTKRWKLPHWKDVDIKEDGMLIIYTSLVDILKRCIVFPNQMQYEMFALWIIASYKREAFDSISFLMFQGLVESGKTRGLDLLRELGYQMIHTTGVTFPAMCRYTDKYQAGILIDEIDNKIDTRTEAGRAYLDFLKPSYRKGSVYATANREDQDETKEYSNYGFKAFAGEQGGFDVALRSRCIIFKMEQAYPDIPDLKYAQNELDNMQNLLLNYRFKTDDPKPLPMDFPLKGRDRELFTCLISIAQHIGLDYQHITDFINKRTEEKIETLQESDEYFVLKAIHAISTKVTLDDAPEEIKYSGIASECGWDDDSEVSKQKRQKIGYVLKKMQLKVKRKRDGQVFLLNDENNLARLPHLYQRYYVT
jgi:hypothetical protein